jgi:hypothetical protein
MAITFLESDFALTSTYQGLRFVPTRERQSHPDSFLSCSDDAMEYAVAGDSNEMHLPLKAPLST